MKQKQTIGKNGRGFGKSFRTACLASCQKMLAQVKAVIFEESRRALAAHEHLLQLALNEAEALAWQTTYPHLVFPTLATEKVQAVAEWSTHQRAVRRTNPYPGRLPALLGNR